MLNFCRIKVFVLRNKIMIRFLITQEKDYAVALSEIKRGEKQTHWMWYIFPQIFGIGESETSKFYAILNIGEAKQYIEHPILGKRLIKISEVLLALEGKTAEQIFGYPDYMKLHSCMTLFAKIDGVDPVFNNVLNKYFGGIEDAKTVSLLSNNL